MKRSFSKSVALGCAVAALGLVPGCAGGQLGALGAAACPQLHSGGDPLAMNFSANARANAKIKGFVAAAKSLMDVSVQMEGMAADACRKMGYDLGLSDAHMAPQSQDPGAQAQAACGAVSAQIDAILAQGVQVRVAVTPPHCTASVDAQARCQGACDVSVDPGQIVAQCEPARLSGQCSGRCVGQCDGNCQGDCQGTCTAQDAMGRCAGQCQGTCSGSCDTTCHARCDGQWSAPHCEGQVRPPSADAECNASCNAHANLKAQCTPPQVQVIPSANVEMAARLVATLQANLPQLLHAQIALGQRVMADARVVVNLGAQLPNVVGDAGAQALMCVTAAAQGAVAASARIDVSVRASASVSGKVGAG